MTSLAEIADEVTRCRRCPRLVRWREQVAREKVRRFTGETYWGKPVPGFGDAKAELVLVGLAPAAHGGNRTGRLFTGDRSGDWLYRALHKAGFANQVESTSRADGLKLSNCFVTAVCRCAPPRNRLLPVEIRNCSRFLLAEFSMLKKARVIVALGGTAFRTVVDTCRTLGWCDLPRRPRFAHGAVTELNPKLTLIGSYHPSQQNTFTGRLTEPMFDSVFRHVNKILRGL